MPESELNPYLSPVDEDDESSSRSRHRPRSAGTISLWQAVGMMISAVTAGIALLYGVVNVAQFSGQLVHHGLEWPEALFQLHGALVQLAVAAFSFQALRAWRARRWWSACACNLACLPIVWILDALIP